MTMEESLRLAIEKMNEEDSRFQVGDIVRLIDNPSIEFQVERAYIVESTTMPTPPGFIRGLYVEDGWGMSFHFKDLELVRRQQKCSCDYWLVLRSGCKCGGC